MISYIVDSGLAAAGGSHQHDSVPHFHGLIQLDDFLDLQWNDLQVLLGQHTLYFLLEATVVVVRNLDARKQVGQDGLEEDGVVLFELRIGPYEELEESEDAAEVLNEAFGLSTGVLMVPGQQQPPPESIEPGTRPGNAP